MTEGFRALLNRFAMTGLEHQLVLRQRLGEDPDWTLSMREGRAAFGEDRSYAIHLLGSLADESGSWLWAWGNEAMKAPTALVASAKKVRQFGKKRQVPELLEPEYPPDAVGIDAHALAIVATHVAELPAYFRFPYEGGSLFAALEIPGFALPAPDPQRLVEVAREVCARDWVEPRTALTTYFGGRGARVEAAKSGLRAHLPDGRTLVAVFDAAGKLATLSVEGAPAELQSP